MTTLTTEYLDRMAEHHANDQIMQEVISLARDGLNARWRDADEAEADTVYLTLWLGLDRLTGKEVRDYNIGLRYSDTGVWVDNENGDWIDDPTHVYPLATPPQQEG